MEFVMKTFKRILLVALSILGTASCVDNPTPLVDNEKIVELQPFYIFGQFMSLNNWDNSVLDSLFPEMKYPLDALHSISLDYSSLSGVENYYGGAIFLHNKKTGQVGYVRLNQQFLSQGFNNDRFYRIFSNTTVPQHEKNNLFWEVFNYQNLNYSKLLTMSKKIEFLKLFPADTLDITNGLEFDYEGAENAELVVQINFNSGLTASLIHPDSAKYGGKLLLRVSDSGKLSLTPEQLQRIRGNGIYDISLLHFTFDEDTLANGKRSGYFTSSLSSIPLFLKR
ncbi:MAG TPA: hypothetical protein VEC36_03495 [Patescibacteria group bacterium]|nr:hypothetical protein [Patescibacteria group bacterium]